ncbi:MAG: flagellar basal body-associated protein FliL [Burkholderiaceae bacterium]|nr:flagellar basal body-associated protein FliL [Burkholderiaceae bacterium]
MAEMDAKAEEAKAPKKSKSKLLLVVGVGATLLAAGGGAAAYLLIGKKDAPQAAEQKGQPKKTPVFVDLESFTVNLRDEDNDRFMQVKLVAEMRDTAAGEVLKNMMPAVRSEILLLLSSKKAADLATREAKEKLAQEIIAAANKPLERTPAEKGVEAVNFTHLIIQ